MARLFEGGERLPLWVRKAIVDAIEGAVAAIAVTSWVVPDSVSAAKQQAIVFSVAIAGATIAAFRRAFLDRGLAAIRDRVLGPDGGEG